MLRLKPQLLVADQNVMVKYDNEGKSEAHAYVQQLSSGFQIVINVPSCQKLYNASWIKGRIAFVEFLDAVMVHEISHIRYGSLAEKLPMRDGIAHYIDNCLEDNRIEYSLVLEFPIFANHIRWVLSALKREANTIRVKNKESVERVDKLLSQLYYMVRFGSVMPDADEDFASFSLPLILSSTRGTRKNTLIAAKAIYDYLQEVGRQDGADAQQDMGSIASTVQSLDQGEADAIMEQGEQIASSNPLNVLQQAAESDAKRDADDTVPSTLPGSGLDQMEAQDGDNSFYQQVLDEHGEVIADIRQVFKILFEKPKWVHTYDGEVNVKMQSELYMASFTGEPVLGYQQLKRMQPDLQLGLFRDVSGSTASMKEAYAAANVAFLAAVDGVHGIKTCSIDFGDSHLVTKTFDETVREGRIQPRSEGGTNIDSALKAAREMEWRAYHRMAIVITDGEIYGNGYKAEMARQTREQNIFYRMVSVDTRQRETINYGENLIHCGVNQLPEVVEHIVLEKLGVI